MTGRPTLLTPDLEAVIVTNLASGCTIKDAAMAAGVSERTFLAWKARGEAYANHLEQGGMPEQSEEVYLHFLQVSQEARAKARVASVAQIRRAGQDDWKAALAYLERSDPQQYGRVLRQQVEVSGPQGGPIELIRREDEVIDVLEAELAVLAGDTPELEQ